MAIASAMNSASGGAAQGRDQHQQRHHGQVLEQQHAHHALAVLGLSSSSRSAISLTTMAVLLMASAPDSASAVCQPSARPAAARRGEQQRWRRCRGDGEHHLHQPEPEHMLAHRAQLGQVELEPDHEHQEHHAELAQVPHALVVLRQRERVRADQHARRQVAQHRRQLERTADHHADHCGQQVHQREIERGHGPMLARAMHTRIRGIARPCRGAAQAAGRPTDKIRAMSTRPPQAFAADREALRLAQDHLRHRGRRRAGPEVAHRPSFVAAVHQILAVRGRVVVMGMGKSGHVGRKVAATLASTGTPAMFVHPAEASHGDLGMIKAVDLVLAISNSGESDELTAILPVVKRQGVPLIAMTGNAGSTLARHADLVLDSSVEKEACPLNLAPTASTTAQMALGDALAVALLDARGFGSEDFARSHPGGALGRKLLTHLVATSCARRLGAARRARPPASAS
jgi:D-arabinose 5-phosphate isomerase GutQ